jgi:hypothetical protein
VARITIEGVKFRGWRAHELQTKHLVTIEIKPELASCAMTRIIQGMMMRNSLRGEVLSAWIIPGELPTFKVLKYFADDELHKCLLERRNGDQGWNIFLHVGAQFNKAHISQQPGAQAAALAEAAELRVEQDKKKVIERAKAMLTGRPGKPSGPPKPKPSLMLPKPMLPKPTTRNARKRMLPSSRTTRKLPFSRVTWKRTPAKNNRG